MKKNKKSLRYFLEKLAINQVWSFITWLVVLIVVILIAWLIIWLVVSVMFGQDLPEFLTYKSAIPWTVSIIVFFFFARKTFLDGKSEIDANCVMLLECFGKFVGDKTKSLEEDKGVLKEGLNFVFPYLKILKKHNGVQYFLGQMLIPIFEDKTKTADLKDASVCLTANVTIQITDPRVAAYDNSDYLKIIKEIVQAAIADSIKNYTMTEAKERRGEFKLFNIFASDQEKQNNLNNPDAGKIPEEIIRIEKVFGIKLWDIIISDIDYTDEQIEQMMVISKAENEKEKSSIENLMKIEAANNRKDVGEIDANTESMKLGIITEADAKRIKDLGSANGEALKNYLAQAGIGIDDHKELEALKNLNESSLVVGDSLWAILEKLVKTKK